MGFSGQLLTVTNKGLQVDLKWHAGAQPHFTRFGFGEGSLAGAAPELLTNMIAPVCYKAISSIVVTTGQAVAMVTLDRADIPREFVWREIALFARDPDTGGEILYAYGNAGSAGQVLSPASMDAQVLRVPIKISRTDNITFESGSGVYVTREEVNAEMAGKASKPIYFDKTIPAGSNGTYTLTGLAGMLATDRPDYGLRGPVTETIEEDWAKVKRLQSGTDQATFTISEPLTGALDIQIRVVR